MFLNEGKTVVITGKKINQGHGVIESAHESLVGLKGIIRFYEDDAYNDEAYKRWINGQNPTDSKEWKLGVVMTFKEVVSKS